MLHETSPKEMQARVDDVRALAAQCQTEMRRVSHELRPAILDELGLAEAVRALVERMAKHAHIEIACDVRGEVDRVPVGRGDRVLSTGAGGAQQRRAPRRCSARRGVAPSQRRSADGHRHRRRAGHALRSVVAGYAARWPLRASRACRSASAPSAGPSSTGPLPISEVRRFTRSFRSRECASANMVDWSGMAVCSRCHKDWPDQYWVCPEDGTVLTAARTASGQIMTSRSAYRGKRISAPAR